jgi:hypothetical protein
MKWWPFASRRQREQGGGPPTLADYLAAVRENDDGRRFALVGAIQAMLVVIDQCDGLARLEVPSLLLTGPYPATERPCLLQGLADARQRTQALLADLGATFPAQDMRSVLRHTLRQVSDELADVQQRFAHGYGPPVPGVTEDLTQRLHALFGVFADLLALLATS